MCSDLLWWNVSGAFGITWLDQLDATRPCLFPNPFDIYGCWSCFATILIGNKPVILYTGNNSKDGQVKNLVSKKKFSDPYLREWIKYTENPHHEPPRRDQTWWLTGPTTRWRARDGKWRILVESKKNNTRITFHYQSVDFVNWSRHKTPFYQAADTHMWECPDFFPVLINNTMDLIHLWKKIMNAKVNHVLKVGTVEWSKRLLLDW